MLQYVYHTLTFFRKAFSRNITWLMFCMVILGFIGTHEMRAVTSFCQFWGLDTTGYKALLHFFRASTWSLDKVVEFWWQFVLSQNETVTSHERAVLLGDHTCVPKDGRKMPCVVTMHQHSETQSKPSYFRGHYWGAIGMLIGSMASPFCIPMSIGIHQGLVHVKEKDPDTLGTRIIQMALDFAIKHDIPSILVLDAFFPGRAVFKLAQTVWSIRHQCPVLTLVIRAKKNCVAYFEAEQPRKRGPGRPRQYGEKIKVSELFDHQEYFSNVECAIYGKVEMVLIVSLDLLWKPTAGLIRFVLAVTKRGPIILMCSDLNQDPVAALELYCARVRIETMFDMLKNLMGVFHYRFWTKSLERHSRKPRKNKYLKKPTSGEQMEKVRLCFAAYERFVMIGAIALGLLQLISIKYGESVWKAFKGFLRTKSRKLPSERTVKFVIADLLIRNLFSLAPGAVIREIQGYIFTKKVVEPECQEIELKPKPETTVIET